MILQGPAGRETWLEVDLRRGGANITGWMQSGELQRRVTGDGGWLVRPRGRSREGWSVEEHNWEGSHWLVPSSARAWAEIEEQWWAGTYQCRWWKRRS